MADLLPLAELEMRILLLPPISCGAHLDGPALYARQLVELWNVNDDDDVPLAQAFRLLDTEAIEGAISRMLVKDDGDDYPGDPRAGARPLEERLRELTQRPPTEQDTSARLRARLWQLPSFKELLPELHKLAWQAILAGSLLAEGTKEGKCHDAIPPTALSGLRPDMEGSRLTLDERGEFINVRVRRAPSTLAATELADVAAFTGQQIVSGPLAVTEATDTAAFAGQQIISGALDATEAADVAAFARPIQRPWGGGKLSPAKLRAAMEAIERDFPNARNDPDKRPAFSQVHKKVNDFCGTEVPQHIVRSLLNNNYPYLKRGRGQRLL